jgi:hypothetical protein
VKGSNETLSITAAAEQLGVSRWSVWRMIADGDLDAESDMRGSRVTTRVQLPEYSSDDPAGSPPRSRTARLQERVDRLTHSVECLSEMLLHAERERAELRMELERQYQRALHQAPALSPRLSAPPAMEHTERPAPVSSPAPVYRSEPAARPAAPRMPEPVSEPEPEPPAFSSLPHGITARPNPMTHPATTFSAVRGPAGEELLQPVRHLFKRDEQRRPWWQKFPVVGS